MNIKNIRLLGLSTVLICIGIIVLSFYKESIILLFLGIGLLLVSIITVIIVMGMDIFRQDRILDKEKILKQGLHIVDCKNCGKENVFEDQYCVYCGEELVINNE